MIIEKAFFFRTGDRPLYGVMISPDPDNGGTPPSGRGLVICDSLFEEKSWCERVMVNLGRRLAKQGHIVLSFDYHGYGNSTGDSGDMSVSSIERDIAAACDLVRGEGADAISLLGTRWGAAPACRVAAARPDIDSIYLVNPVDNWKRQIGQAMRANVAGQYAIFRKVARTREQIIGETLETGECVEAGYRMNNIDGYIFSSDFYSEAIEVTIPVEMPAHIKAVTVFSVPDTPGPVREDPLVEKMNVPGGTCEGVGLTEDNAFWINNRIFTSFTPGFFEEMEKRMAVPPAGETVPASPPPAASESFSSGGVRETAVDIESTEGYLLKAVIYEPDGVDKKDYGFVFTHGGLIGMNGAFRFNTRAARRFAAAGFPSICADTHGVGRSGGVTDNQEQRTLFRKICIGLFAGDVHDASVLLKERAGVSKTAVFGVCGGAITGILAHSKFEDLDESVLLSVPVMLPSLNYGEVRMTEGYARFYIGMYARKIFNPKAWWRFITFQSENRMIFKSLWVAVSGKAAKLFGGDKSSKKPAEKEKAKPQARQAGLETAVPGIGDDLQFNPAFLESFNTVIERGRRIYFIFGDNDNFKWEFNSEFLEGCSDDVARAGDLIRIDTITHANHMYTLREWQDEIILKCIDWASGA